jgi:hypothetical protein
MLRGPFRFDRTTHRYSVGRRAVPGITSVIRAAGHSDYEWVTAEAMRRGTAVHAATLAHDLGDDPLLPPEWQPYLWAYLEFRRAVRCVWSELEQPRVERALGFAGTPDRVGIVSGRPALLELKTAASGQAVPWHGIQTAAQDMLLGGVRGQRQRLVVYLMPDGRFRLREHTDPRDYLQFLEALRGYEQAA